MTAPQPEVLRSPSFILDTYMIKFENDLSIMPSELLSKKL